MTQKAQRESTKERNARFVEAYFAKGENATEAYLAIKPTVARNTAGAEGHKLLKTPEIYKAIEKRRAEIRAQFALTTDRVFQEHARIAYFNPKKLVDANGKAIPLHQLDDDTAAALSHVEVTETEVKGTGKDKQVITRKIKGRPFNKTGTLREVSKILRLYDKPPPPPPDEEGRQVAEDPRETARRMAFLLRAGAAAEGKAQAKPARPAKKKLTIPA